MDREQLLKLIDEKINEIFVDYQNANGITNGDIHPFDAFRLDQIEEALADLIERVGTYQKRRN